MFGDSFFTIGAYDGKVYRFTDCFRPHVWGFFFHNQMAKELTFQMKVEFSSPCMGILFSHACQELEVELKLFSSPCMGILFSQDTIRRFARRSRRFSSPCMGILFSQQAWDAPRGGLSMALLRRGFPIDWNSHYFHLLTFCFLRFHAHRRGFSK